MYRRAHYWVAEAAWGADQVDHDENTGAFFRKGNHREAAIHVERSADGRTVRAPICFCLKDNIDRVVMGSFDGEGDEGKGIQLHGTVPLGQALRFMPHLEYDEQMQSPYFALPLDVFDALVR